MINHRVMIPQRDDPRATLIDRTNANSYLRSPGVGICKDPELGEDQFLRVTDWPYTQWYVFLEDW